MALTIKQLTNYSWMSQASYLDFTGLTQNNPDALKGKQKNSIINAHNVFTATQAETFLGSNTANSNDGFSKRRVCKIINFAHQFNQYRSDGVQINPFCTPYKLNH